MPQLFAFALVGAACYTGYRLLQRLGTQMSAELDRAQQELRRRAAETHAAANGTSDEKNLGALEYDPKSGVYKPALSTPGDSPA